MLRNAARIAVAVAEVGGHALLLAGRGELPAWVPGLMIGGALANAADRLATGAVHD